MQSSFWAHPRVLPLSAGLILAATIPAMGQSLKQIDLPDAPSALLTAKAETGPLPDIEARRADTAGFMSDEYFGTSAGFSGSQQTSPDQSAADAARQSDHRKDEPQIPKGQQQQQRIFGVLANFQSVSAGAKPVKAGWRTDFKIANKSNYDYTALGFVFVTSALAYAQDSHPSLSTVNGGDAVYWAYLWRGFVDKTDGSYQAQFLFPALLHEDVRYYAMGHGSKVHRTLHAMSSIVVAHTYSGRPIPNFAGIAGKVGTQAVSTTYYPSGSQDFGVLATKFAYACMRQAGFAILREFSPDLKNLSDRRHRHQAADTP
ncbi:hypothetical protein [Terriglobus roseus]|uniref:Uncharacterized protein n=1 Tax=Terriglobus roseus TaxID=392734 RepID=A0A1H4KPQ4_9BACT|nr:hypothetical protein [Terriglobus roseus]SEB60477.1 hypothetical protein SAMN05443244_1299 [Terriglobus roseus]